MFDKNNRLESQSSRQRYLYGKSKEELIIECLRNKHGFVIEDVTMTVDCEKKIDCFLIENDEKIPCQVKTRMGYSGKDVLVDLFEPFWGIDNEATQAGRDYVGQYEKYIVLIENTIYIIDGKRQKKIIEDVLEEWKVSHFQLPVFDSCRYKGIQLRYTRDRNNSRPKVLMFIPPKTYEADEIQQYLMK